MLSSFSRVDSQVSSLAAQCQCVATTGRRRGRRAMRARRDKEREEEDDTWSRQCERASRAQAAGATIDKYGLIGEVCCCCLLFSMRFLNLPLDVRCVQFLRLAQNMPLERYWSRPCDKRMHEWHWPTYSIPAQLLVSNHVDWCARL